MSDVIKRTRNGVANPLHLERRFDEHTPDYFPPNSSDWIMTRGPAGFPMDDLSGVAAVDPKYWETSGDTVVEMNQAGKDAVDQAVLDAHNASTEAVIKGRLANSTAPLEGITWTATATGMTLIININSLVVNNITTIGADPTLEKFVRARYLHIISTDALTVQVAERTDGQYAVLTADQEIAAELGQWKVVANGTELVVEV